MADNEEGPTEITPGFKLTTTEIDWERKGRLEEVGRQNAGAHDAFQEALNRWLANHLGQILKASSEFAADQANAGAATVAKQQGEGLAEAEKYLGKVVQLMLGLTAPETVGKAIEGDGAFKGRYRDLAAAWINEFFPREVGPGEIPLTQAQENLAALMEHIMRMELESWAVGVIAELIPFIHLDQVGTLKDSLVNAFGLSRLLRVALRPIYEIGIADPIEKDLNERHTPKLLSPGELVRARLRGAIEPEIFEREMARQGWAGWRARLQLDNARKAPTPTLLADLVRLQVLTEEQGVDFLELDGWDRQTAAMVLRAERDKKFFSLQDEVAKEAIAQYSNRTFDEAELERVLLAVQYTTEEVALAKSLGDLKRAAARELTLGQLEEAFRAGLISLARLRDRWDQLGYSERDQVLLEELLEKSKLSHEDVVGRRESRAKLKVRRNRN